MLLTRKKLEKYDPETRDFKDMRKRVARAVFSYFDENEIEYRKSFTAPTNTSEAYFWDISPEIIVCRD